MAEGSIIQFLDADDLLHPKKLELQTPVLVSGVSEVVYCNWLTVPWGRSGRQRLCAPSLLPDPVVFALHKIVQTPSPLFWKKSLERVGGFRTELPCAQEYDLLLRLACEGATFHHLEECLYTNRLVAGSISSNPVRVIDQWREIYWRAYRRLEERGELSEERAVAFAAGFTRQGRAYLQHGLPDKAAERFREAFLMHPTGGVCLAYGPSTRALRRLLGAAPLERLVLLKRSLTRNIPWSYDERS